MFPCVAQVRESSVRSMKQSQATTLSQCIAVHMTPATLSLDRYRRAAGSSPSSVSPNQIQVSCRSTIATGLNLRSGEGISDQGRSSGVASSCPKVRALIFSPEDISVGLLAVDNESGVILALLPCCTLAARLMQRGGGAEPLLGPAGVGAMQGGQVGMVRRSNHIFRGILVLPQHRSFVRCCAPYSSESRIVEDCCGL